MIGGFRIGRVWSYRTARVFPGVVLPRNTMDTVWEYIPRHRRDNHIVVEVFAEDSHHNPVFIFFHDGIAIVGKEVKEGNY